MNKERWIFEIIDRVSNDAKPPDILQAIKTLF